MTNIIIGISAVGVTALILFVVIRIIRRMRCAVLDWDKNDLWLMQEFRRCNVEVFGKKGSGKDLLFAHAIELRGEPHYSNMPYNELTEVRKVGDLCLNGNTFSNVIRGDFHQTEPVFEDGRDFYISDGGIFMPCQYNTELNKAYPSMPMFFALSRQLYNMNIHVNVQAPTRIWDKLREQADSYIKVCRCRDCGDYFVVNCICYDDYNLAVKGTLPEDNRTSFTAEYRRFRVYKEYLQYDTRHFRDVFLEKESLLQDKKPSFAGYMLALKRFNAVKGGEK